MGSEDFKPAYLKLAEGELNHRAEKAHAMMSNCELCARRCAVDRLHGELGICRTGELCRVSSYGSHLGEEDPLRGWLGSGTIFFSRCNLRCQYCQNYDISQSSAGQEIPPTKLATIMLDLQNRGCHNINLVSPSHVVAQILAGLGLAIKNGLNLPLVYNTGGYDSLEALQLLDGVIDIYMPDMKYASSKNADSYSRAKDYPTINRLAVKEMHRQVGDLEMNESGLATRGLLVRHLVLPNNLAGTRQVVRFLADEISTNTYLNLMDQYQPAYHANQYILLNRPINEVEYDSAVQAAQEAGLHRLDRRCSLLSL